MPLCRKNKRGCGIAGGDDPLAGFKSTREPDRGDVVYFIRTQPSEQRLLAEMGRLGQAFEAAIAIDHLIFRPFDCVVEQQKMTQFRQIVALCVYRLPELRRLFEAGDDEGDAASGEASERLRQ